MVQLLLTKKWVKNDPIFRQGLTLPLLLIYSGFGQLCFGVTDRNGCIVTLTHIVQNQKEIFSCHVVHFPDNLTGQQIICQALKWMVRCPRVFFEKAEEHIENSGYIIVLANVQCMYSYRFFWPLILHFVLINQLFPPSQIF